MMNEISISKVQLGRTPNSAFLFNLCCQLETVIDKSISTAATDGLKLYINPDFFNSLDQDERVFLLAHETLHCAYLHMARLTDKDPVKWNVACDYVINLQLDDFGFTFIKGGCLSEQYRGMSAEQVYDLLPNNLKPPQFNDLIFNPDIDTDKIQSNVMTAAMQAELQKQQGSIPNDIKRFLDNLTKPKIDWKTVLKRFLLDISKDDYSWKKPNRRTLHRGIYTPSLYSFGLSKITFAIDVSGSVSQKEFDGFMSELYGCMETCKPNKLEVIQWHHNIADHSTVHSLSELSQLKLSGHGGTNPNCAIDLFNKTDSKALIIITDGEFSKPKVTTTRPVIWAIFNNKQFVPPYGTVIYLE